MTGRLLALVPDLIDRSKVSAAASGFDGFDAVEFVSSANALASRLDVAGAAGHGEDDEEAIVLVLLDLSRPGSIDCVAAAVALGARVVGFGSHVDTEVLAAARNAGCDEVLPRSTFFGRLGQVLAG